MIPFFLLKLWKGRDYSVFNPVDNREYTVNYAGFRILEKCDGTHTPEEIVGVIVRDFGKTENEAIGYVSQFLDSMTRHGMIAWRKETVNNVPDWGPPTTVFWDITRRCNLLCSHCYNIEKQPRGDELSTEIVKRIVEELSAYGVSNIVFSGGEPFLRKDFLAIIQHVSAYAFQDVSIATNGVLVDGKSAKKLKKAGVNVQVSIDGDTAVLHDEIRGVSGAFDGAIRGIHLLQTVGVPVSVCTVVTKKNVNRIDRIIALMHDLHIDNYRVQGVMSIGRGKTNKADLRLTPARMKRLVMQLETRAIPVSSYNFTLTDPPGGPVNFKGTGACAAATSSCSITTEGTVVPCTYFWGIKGDNVRDHTFGWIWENSPVLQYFRSIRLDEVKGLCGDCRWLAHCHGGCKAENYATGDIFSSNISCWVADANRRSASKKKTLMKG
jgi:radical SAM protein with 4Fe4S-binding SPASM domain